MKPHNDVTMEIDDYRLIIDQLAEGNIFYILISGGEPFMHPRIYELIKYASEKINEVSIVTNGTMLSQEHFDFFKEMDTSNLHLQVSLDSIVEEENLRLRNVKPSLIIENIETLLEIGVQTSVGIVLTTINSGSIYKTLEYLGNLVNHFNLMIVQNTVGDNKLTSKIGIGMKEVQDIYNWIESFRENNDIYITIPEDIEGTDECTATGSPCNAGFSYLAIDPDLRVRPCDRVTNRFIGDLKNETIQQIWHSQVVADINSMEYPICKEYR
jgi:MoaA/NifB/PqqE/SkfB family radical SAM enzyme